MDPISFLNNYLTEKELKEFVISNRHLDSHKKIIQTLDLESHYSTILKRLFPNIPPKKKPIPFIVFLDPVNKATNLKS